MNELMQIEINDRQEQVVSARELHENLGIKKDFSDWFKYQCEKLSLISETDFTTILGKTSEHGGRPCIDYHIPIDTAKHFAMMSGGEKAYEVRQYFIKVERAWNSPDQVMARALQVANMTISNYQNTISLMEPKVQQYEDLLSVKDNQTMNDAAKAIGVGRNKLFEVLRNKKVLIKGANIPYQTYIDRGYFLVREVVIKRSEYDDVKRQTLVTTKGLAWLNEKVREWGLKRC